MLSVLRWISRTLKKVLRIKRFLFVVFVSLLWLLKRMIMFICLSVSSSAARDATDLSPDITLYG